MTISDSSSAAAARPNAKPRKVIALTGPSVPVDPRQRAVRRDLAELDLAGQVFAQHYAIPLVHVAQVATPVRSAPATDAAVLTMLSPGAAFHVLDTGGSWAWGRGDAPGSVGYVDVAALALP